KPYFRSVMAVPMTDHEHFNGIAIVLHKDPYFFSFESFKLIQSLVQHSTLAFANSMLREELEQTIITDYLTKLHSRNYLDECIIKHVQEDQSGHFILFDIDNFKQINDTYGHQKGDDVIRQVARAIQEQLGNLGIAARWGGEELAVYLPFISKKEAYDLADKIRERISIVTIPSVTVSCGLSSWNAPDRPDGKQIVAQADQALYRAKEFGKNRLIVAGAK
ncbi:sensor domain-containing diguanylate cyclase, partial [Halobacillus sp. BBL2006]|uniref:sensor domain-containing diguanylate cyclase n=1 Tax=Halobacillus sp. BBL2006 TaxID=1543706 RepID=UPI000542D478